MKRQEVQGKMDITVHKTIKEGKKKDCRITEDRED